MPTAPACPGSLITRPRVCDNHRRPPRSSRRCLTAVDTRPSAPPKVPIGAPRRRESPPATVPLGLDPERSSGLVRMRFRFTPSRSPTGTNLRPPNRPNPVGLIRPPATHQSPARVWASAVTWFSGRPSGVDQDRKVKGIAALIGKPISPRIAIRAGATKTGRRFFGGEGADAAPFRAFRSGGAVGTSLVRQRPSPPPPRTSACTPARGRISLFRRPTWAGKPVPRARASPPRV